MDSNTGITEQYVAVWLYSDLQLRGEPEPADAAENGGPLHQWLSGSGEACGDQNGERACYSPAPGPHLLAPGRWVWLRCKASGCGSGARLVGVAQVQGMWVWLRCKACGCGLGTRLGTAGGCGLGAAGPAS